MYDTWLVTEVNRRSCPLCLHRAGHDTTSTMSTTHIGTARSTSNHSLPQCGRGVTLGLTAERHAQLDDS